MESIKSNQISINIPNYSGPLEVLLDLAKNQKVDLADISITQLADQFLEYIKNKKELNLETASEFLLMATWLAYLKSKLLLPEDEDEDFKDLEVAEKIRTAELEKQMAKINKQISSEYKDTMKSLKMKSNKYGSSQLQQTKKIINSVTKEDFKTYNVTSLISYYFFDSMSNYLESLEFLYRAYDKNTDADKLKAQIAYLKSSKGSEKDRLESTKQIINIASLEVQADVQDESIVLSDEAKINYQKALPFAFKATDSGYKLFVVSKGLVTEIKGSGNLLGTLLKNANELKGAATVVPLIPDYIKKVGGTAKLIFSGAKTKKIKDKENLSTALDELDLSA